MTDVRGRHARLLAFDRLKQLVRTWGRRFDRARLAYFDATYTPIGQHAVRLLIVSVLVLVVLLFSVALIWTS